MNTHENHGVASMRPCLEPLLRALHWRGTPRQLAEAQRAGGAMDLLELCNTMANLGFGSRSEAARLATLDPRLLPCVFLSAQGTALAVLGAGAAPNTLVCFDVASGATRDVVADRSPGRACFFAQVAAPAAAGQGGWVRALLHRFDATALGLLALSFMLSLLAMAPAFFVQAVYDRVLATQERATLGWLAAGAVLVLLCDTVLRLLRGAALAQVGARLDYLIGSATVAKLLSLPLFRLEMSCVGGQVARLRQFEQLRQVFTGPLALACLELPFMLVYVIALAVLGGWLALVPLTLAVALVLAGLVLVRHMHSAGTPQQGEHQALLVEILGNMAAIKAGGAEAIWLARFRERSAQVAFCHLHHARVGALSENLAQAINLVAGATTLGIGAALALDGQLSVGALIASMALVWRALAPVQSLFLSLTRAEDIGAAVRGIEQMMALPSEGGTGSSARGRRFAGGIAFNRVVQRYDAHSEPALAGVSFVIRPGEVVAVSGGNGSGKSSLLKLIASLYPAQAGAVLIDGVDVRQIDPLDLRQAIAYLPQQADLFAGTLADNLRLAHPAASAAALRDACARAGVLAEIDALPQGLDTPASAQLPTRLVRRLALARTWLVDAGIVLLDEPEAGYGDPADDPLLQQLEALRGRCTVVLVTHAPRYLQVADRVIVLRQGTVVHDGTPRELMSKLAAGTA